MRVPTRKSIIHTLHHASVAQEPSFGGKNIDDFVEKRRKDSHGVGLVGWSIGGEGNAADPVQLLQLGTAGERIHRPWWDKWFNQYHTDDSLKTNLHTRHHIGSCTKSMTATLIAILIQDGVIPSWDSTLREVLPDLVDCANVYRNVTLREVAAMKAGFPANLDNWFEYENMSIREARKKSIQAALASDPVHAPGSAFLYSNTGFVLLGHVVEAKTGETWEEALATRLFAPLGIDLGKNSEAFVGPLGSDSDPWAHISFFLGYWRIPCDPSKRICDNPRVLGPAGSFSGPMEAMARYYRWHLACELDDEEIINSPLTKENCRELHQNVDGANEYGYGWLCSSHETWGRVCWHNGSNTFNYYCVYLLLDQNLAYVGYTNAGMGKDCKMVNDMIQHLITRDMS